MNKELCEGDVFRVETENTYYDLRVRRHPELGPILWACEAGLDPATEERPVIAVYPSVLPFLEETVETEQIWDGRIAGYNRQGIRTFLLVPLQVRTKMVLANRAGFRSTPIRRIIG